MLLPGFLRPVSYLQPFQRVEVVLFLLAGLSLALFQYRFHCAASVLSYGRPNTSAQLSIVTPSCRWWFDVQTHRGFCGRSGIRTRDVLRFFAAYPRHYPFSDYSSVAFDHSAILPLYCALRFRRKVMLHVTSAASCRHTHRLRCSALF